MREKLQTLVKAEIGSFYSGGYPLKNITTEQNWLFETESESLIVSIGSEGGVILSTGVRSSADVVIEIKHDILSGILKDKVRVEGPWKVTFLTRRGESAFTYLWGNNGL
jgi:hypothetical protein